MKEKIHQNGNGHIFKNIVLATDFLESSRLALDYAVALCHRFGSTLTLLHVFELMQEAEEAEIITHRPSVSRAMAAARLEALASGVRRLGIDIKVDLREGESCAVILSAAAESQCGLLVLGTHGIYRGIQHFVLGSNAEKILLASHCPTLTVGRHVMAGIDLDLKVSDILVISDLSADDVRPASFGLKLRRDFGVPVDLVHVRTDDGGTDAKWSDRLAAQYRGAFGNNPAEVDPRWLSSHYHLGRILRAHDVIRLAEVAVNSLIVTGVKRTTRIDRHLHTSFAFELAARAASPLLSIPSREP